METQGGYTRCNKKCKNPSYEEVCSSETGCSEAIEITFDSEKISYNELLNLFWTNHDPTTINRQGYDVGTQYKSVIYYHNEKQKQSAKKSKEKKEKRLINKSDKTVTEIEPASKFYSAENYHQKYFEKTGRSCHLSRNVFK